MPVYQYRCDDCGPSEFVRPMSERNEPLDCPGCGTALERVIASAPRLGSTSRARIAAHATNERARHEPILASRGEPEGGAHRAGCGCCGGTRGTATRTAANGAKSFPTRRPWMIAH